MDKKNLTQDDKKKLFTEKKKVPLELIETSIQDNFHFYSP